MNWLYTCEIRKRYYFCSVYDLVVKLKKEMGFFQYCAFHTCLGKHYRVLLVVLFSAIHNMVSCFNSIIRKSSRRGIGLNILSLKQLCLSFGAQVFATVPISDTNCNDIRKIRRHLLWNRVRDFYRVFCLCWFEEIFSASLYFLSLSRRMGSHKLGLFPIEFSSSLYNYILYY